MKTNDDFSDSASIFLLQKFNHKVAHDLEQNPVSFMKIKNEAILYNLSPVDMALVLESDIMAKGENRKTINEIIKHADKKLMEVMYPSILNGKNLESELQFLDSTWDASPHLETKYNLNITTAWKAHNYSMNVQKYNASMGLIAAAPTGGASGTVPGTIKAISEDIEATPSSQVEALLVAGLIGKVAFSRGPVSGSQAGCGGEIGIAAGMAAGAAVHLLGGGWKEIDNAASLVMSNYTALECSPELGLVEYPCIPRNGFAAVSSIMAALSALAGINSPYNVDETMDRIFSLGARLPISLRETESGQWMNSFLTKTICKINDSIEGDRND
jgi:L-serine deaminase